MEQLSAALAAKIADSQGYDKQKEQVLAYGLIAMMQFISIFLIISLVGIIGKFVLESILIFLGVGFLRKSTGGAHSKTMRGCMIASCLNITILAFLSRYVLIFTYSLTHYLFSYTLGFLWCYYSIYRYAPRDTANKKISSPEKRSRLRKQSFILITFYFMVAALLTVLANTHFNLIHISNSLCLLTLWQCFTITPVGVKAIHSADTVLFS